MFETSTFRPAPGISVVSSTARGVPTPTERNGGNKKGETMTQTTQPTDIPLLSLPEDGLMPLRNVLKFIQVGKSTIWRYMKKGEFPQPTMKIGNKQFWRAEDIRAFIRGEWVKP